MLLTTGLVLVVVWLLGAFGLYSTGRWGDGLLLIGLFMLLLAGIRSRDAAVRKGRAPGSTDQR